MDSIKMTTFYILTGGFLVLVAALYIIFRKIQSAANYRFKDYGPATDPMPAAPEDADTTEFTNKYCTRLEDFVIDDSINDYDLQQLAALNGIKLQISRAWYPLVLELVRELDGLGWDRRVSCIKEKYASLRFYTAEQYNEVIDKYTQRSERICETCGARGQVRYHGWEYVACRKHYLQARGEVTLLPDGLNYNGRDFLWSQIKTIRFGDKNYMDRYRHLELHLDPKQFPKLHEIDLRVNIYKSVIGYGALLNHLSPLEPELDYAYIERFQPVHFCAICGYEAVYDGCCECCENDSEEALVQRGYTVKQLANNIQWGQIEWHLDEGEYYEALQPHYRKNPEHKIVFTEQDVADWLKDDEEEK